MGFYNFFINISIRTHQRKEKNAQQPLSQYCYQWHSAVKTHSRNQRSSFVMILNWNQPDIWMFAQTTLLSYFYHLKTHNGKSQTNATIECSHKTYCYHPCPIPRISKNQVSAINHIGMCYNHLLSTAVLHLCIFQLLSGTIRITLQFQDRKSGSEIIDLTKGWVKIHQNYIVTHKVSAQAQIR